MKTVTRIIIADDHPLIAKALQAQLESRPEVSVVGVAKTGNEAIALVKALNPDVVLMDIRMPQLNGIEATKNIVENYPHIKIISITGYSEEEPLYDMLKAGAKGFILKTSEANEILRALEKVMLGEEYYCKEVITVMVKRLLKANPDARKSLRFDGFSDKDVQIIRLVCQQKTAKEIAGLVNLGEKTVEYYRHKIMKEMGVNNNIGMVLYALKHNMVDINEIF